MYECLVKLFKSKSGWVKKPACLRERRWEVVKQLCPFPVRC